MADIKSINGNPIVPESVADGAVGVDGLAEDVVELLDNKADIDGYYSQLTAGLAENLIGRGDAVPAEYLYRTAGGDADIEDGIATVSCIKGNTLVWNQIIRHVSQSDTQYGGTVTRVRNPEDGTVTYNGTAEGTGQQQYSAIAYSFDIVDGHKYYMSKRNDELRYYINVTGSNNVVGMTSCIFTAQESRQNAQMYMVVPVTGYTFNNFVVRPQLFDLTLMFGAGNEPETVEEFEAMFPLPYYPYSAPKLLPVDIRGIETVGFNLLEDSSSFNATKTSYANSIFGSNVQRLTAFKDNLRKLQALAQPLYWHISADITATSSTISVGTLIIYGETTSIPLLTIPNNSVFSLSGLDIDRVGYVVMYGPSPNTPTTFSEACINLSWSGYRNGEYEEHWSAERPIDTSRFFPTGLKKVGDKADALYADHYDTVVGAVVTSGGVNYVEATYGGAAADAQIIVSGLNGVSGGRFCSDQFVTPVGDGAWRTLNVGEARINNNGIWIGLPSTITTVAQANAWLAEHKPTFYYELATPTTTEIDPPLNLSYKVSDFGTERIMVDETADAPQTASVPMEVEYGLNAIDTIRRLPKEYQSHKSMGQLTAALESSLGIDITETWDEDDQRYEYEISEFELADDAVTPQSLSDAVVHGQYPSLSVGRADALTGADSTAQWATRESTGTGSATVRSVQGAAVGWNQMVNGADRNATAYGLTMVYANGKATLSGVAEETNNFWLTDTNIPVVNGHKYLAIGGSAAAHVYINVDGIGSVFDPSIVTATKTTTARALLCFTKDADLTIPYVCYPQLFDLTAMFGSGNEPTTVAEFERMFPEAYYPYSAPTLKPAQIAGISSTDANGNALDSVEWTAQTLRAAGSVADMLYSDHVDVRVGVVDLGTLDWDTLSSPEDHVFRASLTSIVYLPATDTSLPNAQIAGYTPKGWAPISSSDNKCFSLSNTTGDMRRVVIIDHDFSTTEAFSASVSGKPMFYALFSSTTTPISSALPMTYRVEQGGTESIIVPSGEISAAPVLTVAEGESAGDVVMDALACIATPDGPTATANHALNTYLTMGGKLYKVTRVIAVGETIAEGTNVSETTVMAELLALTV